MCKGIKYKPTWNYVKSTLNARMLKDGHPENTDSR